VTGGYPLTVTGSQVIHGAPTVAVPFQATTASVDDAAVMTATVGEGAAAAMVSGRRASRTLRGRLVGIGDAGGCPVKENVSGKSGT